MLLTLVVILILIWSAVVGSLYSNFLTFYQNFTESENYHKARYASIAAIERAELVIKQREPWYIWSWWWILWEYWSTWYKKSDQIISGFSYLSNDESKENKSTMLRQINSRTNRIPFSGEWNVNKLLSTWDSVNYNMIDYDNSEIILLYYDNKQLEYPYKKVSCSTDWQCDNSKIKSIDVSIRLPWFISSHVGLLNINKSLTIWWKENDPIVDRQIKWNYDWEPFTVFATQRYKTPADSAIREEDINNNFPIKFKERWNPIRRSPDNLDSTNTVTIISPKDTEIKNLPDKFEKLFKQSKLTELKLSLLNLLQWTSWSWLVYPFLEYYVELDGVWGEAILSDKYYTIKTEWNYWDYQVNTVMYKPTITESILRSFTTIL